MKSQSIPSAVRDERGTRNGNAAWLLEPRTCNPGDGDGGGGKTRTRTHARVVFKNWRAARRGLSLGGSAGREWDIAPTDGRAVGNLAFVGKNVRRVVPRRSGEAGASRKPAGSL